MKNKKNNKGFTLVELLVVIAIIGILAVVAVPALFKNIEKGKVADLEADMSALRSAILSYYADNSEYPIDDKDGEGTGTELTVPVFTLDKKNGIATDSKQLNETENKGSLDIFSELEGLSFPYGGMYQLTNASGGTTSADVVKSPDTLYLKVTTKDANTTISQAGLDKLEKDLGLTLGTAGANANADKNTIAVRPAVAGTSGQVVIIPLVNK